MTSRRVDSEVPAALDGERIDRVVAMLTDLSRTDATRLVAEGRVRVGGTVVERGRDRLAEGDRIEIDVPEQGGDDRPRPDPAVEVPVVYEDPAVVVVDKPAALVVHPGAGHDGSFAGRLVQHVRDTFGEALPTNQSG